MVKRAAPPPRDEDQRGDRDVGPLARERDRHGFAFMTNEISSERRVEVSIAKIAATPLRVDAAATGLAVMAMLERSWLMVRHNEVAAVSAR